ncbi:MAG: sulfotransferase domain-containing protein [Rhodospirillales bacterium]|nr:sulfotransferase domain-containing protein [Rhodospirillales bacterium]
MPNWPVKTRELHNHHFNSNVWNDFVFRDDDIVIGTYGKSGTTWVQQIVGQLLFGGQPDLHVHEMSPWLDLRAPPAAVKLEMLAAQTHRRFIKTHLPVDALVFTPQAKYLYIARDGRDVLWSLYNHHVSANDMWYRIINDTPGLQGPRLDRPNPSIRQYFLEWLDFDGYPFWSFWDNVSSWWAIRDLPNVKIMHFEDLRRDLAGEMRALAAFLGIAVDETLFPAQVEHCTFAWMKAHAADAAPLGGAMWDGGAESFINKGVNGRWRDVLTEADCARYEEKALAKLGADCAAWLTSGAGA